MLGHHDRWCEDERSVGLFSDEVATVLGFAEAAKRHPSPSVKFDELWHGGASFPKERFRFPVGHHATAKAPFGQAIHYPNTSMWYTCNMSELWFSP